ncbi:zinc-dependent alcohol dehydrogenase [Nocardioides lianchengensis]|uniref:2-desacetyl-2-hydroxyethyl bacteriochlorophyllide A dehydrogenase n=1 Tax=Nocardioides lianchengensis TaxID=1045774 RepID=A0A1G6TQ12_9ACTN|nr:alcohol dehydrogenase catalytic domain-containing protein [Nocardioides lianchengensis]NYG11679.1 2-desacetyl-2-hydroxyethyl bacteriochlorophyllide A dehydrogenase [Nocardioides lianchengensis]SDD31272.1 2-desacetyl-2-hydroxyethyl bacteriochlorophyllide A dehydrogenase [Nocardioides lianchengensis]
MLTASYVGDGTLKVAEAEPVAPAPGEVQVEVAYVGICGTDLHILHGAMDARVAMPAIIGHEMSGTVAALGEGVTGWSIGDPVTVMPLAWDGTCPACRAGHQHVCQHLDFVGIDSPGALQGRWNVRADLLVRLGADVSLQHGALVEPVAVAVHDVRRSEVGLGDTAVVLGGGPIGVLIAVVAAAAGARVLVSEPDAGRRATIASLGHETFDPTAGDLVAHVEAWTGGAGADVVFEVSGAAPAVLAATAVAKVRGTVVVVAIHPQPVPVNLQRVFWRELRILGARVYERADFERAAALIADGSIPADTMITAVLPISEVAEAFASLESGRAMKVLVDTQAVPA